MNRRLYFVLPDVGSAREVMNDLLLARIEERRMHFLGKRGTDLEDLPEAGVLQKTDLLHGAFLGAIWGGAVGAAIALVLHFAPQAWVGFEVGLGAVLPLAVLGALFGGWVSGTLIGSSTPNQHLLPFERDFEQGRILLMVDVPRERVEEIRALVNGRHPEAEDRGVEPLKPAFP